VVTNSKFKFIAGSLCLDFVNTVGGWLPGDTILADKLVAFHDLLDWARLAGVLTPAQARTLTAEEDVPLLRRAVAFRGSLYRVAKSLLEAAPPPAADLDRLNREISAAQSHRLLAYAHGKLIRAWDDPHTSERILWAVAESAAELVTAPEIASVRQCPGDDCGWMFLDTSRNRARRWCQMRICGNRAKVRRFREE
jgi:predicted RNA-binding Zn ribbon-like protein